MSFLNKHTKWRLNPLKGAIALLVALFAAIPTSAFASGGENVVLNYSQQDYIFLGLSLVFGVIALAVGFGLKSSILKMSPGDEKMQEVGRAIKEGALAYLSQQVRTMIIFVVLLAIGLFVLYQQHYQSTMLGAYIAVSFVLGVAASYIAGYTGMLAAVEGNMRTANAALTSYARALQIAFRSGAVAGMITVGMGLIGATLILIASPSDAMKILVGFGFGGSLAALFMRVGGGIFTKAADVGADLVGKVEAGIPEDDPRNPAVIADNVGDNVGDCAGMAADVFESYEVTLVAAIVLGAATASIFDQTTWMKLVMFALMARGIGIIASIIGIFSMKGSDDVNSDPLKFIRKGFVTSALIAGALTTGLAWYMMGGQGGAISTAILVTNEQAQARETEQIRSVRDMIARATKNEKSKWRVTADQVSNALTAAQVRAKLAKTGAVTAKQIVESADWKAAQNPSLTATTEDQEKQAQQAIDLNVPDLGIDLGQQAFAVATAMQETSQPKPTAPTGFSKVNFKDAKNEALNYAVLPPQTSATDTPVPTTVKEFYSVDKKGEAMKPLKVFYLKVTPKQQNTTNPAANQPRFLYYGPAEEKELDDQIKNAESFATITKEDRFAVDLYSNAEGALMLGVAAVGEKGNKMGPAHRVVGAPSFSYFKLSKTDYDKLEADRKTNTQTPPAPSETMKVAVAESKPVEWWRFALAILFGIGMAFAIELLTDYYVSTHKKPVQEVAGVATAGPAPMIISGFALAQESSVFSVFAIVAALMLPIGIFPPEVYGGYILSFYGIALVGLGLLTTTGYILAMDTFGPISDNAQGVFEMSGAGHDNPVASKAVQRLDAAGNTTKALTKGFAIATAVVAAVALFHSYIEGAHLTTTGLPLDVPEIFLGMMIGGAAPYLFSAFSINAVGRASFDLINEVRSQFRNDPGIMAGTSKPNYAKCVEIVTAAAQKELLGPGILAIALPLAVAFGFAAFGEPTNVGGTMLNLRGAQALGGFLAGCILSGQLMAVLLANAGGIWDNAKKLIEDGMHGGKGTEAHKAGIVCDTVGDPFKDTAGPALNPLIKVMNLVALLLAPVVIQPFGKPVLISVTLICIGALAFSIWWSKRSSMSTALTSAAAAEGALPASTAEKAPAKKRITVDDEPEA